MIRLNEAFLANEMGHSLDTTSGGEAAGDQRKGDGPNGIRTHV